MVKEVKFLHHALYLMSLLNYNFLVDYLIVVVLLYDIYSVPTSKPLYLTSHL
jgi:hypothetical protein